MALMTKKSLKWQAPWQFYSKVFIGENFIFRNFFQGGGAAWAARRSQDLGASKKTRKKKTRREKEKKITSLLHN